MERRKRLGRGLEDISHYFISPDTKNDQKKDDFTSQIVEAAPRCQAVSIVDLFDPKRGALLTARIGVTLCKDGIRTLMIDADTRFPSIAFMLGLSIPGYSFRHYLKDQYQPSDVIYTGPFGLKILAPRLNIKDISEMKMPNISLMLETLKSVEKEIDITILRQYEGKLQMLIEEAIFIIPASHTAMIRVYREIKSFIASGGKKGIGIIITDTMDELIAMKAYERIRKCIEMSCGTKPYFCGCLSDVAPSSISSIVSHLSEIGLKTRGGAKGGRLFFERLQYLIGVANNITGEEMANLLG